jgi:hypothetical protein
MPAAAHVGMVIVVCPENSVDDGVDAPNLCLSYVEIAFTAERMPAEASVPQARAKAGSCKHGHTTQDSKARFTASGSRWINRSRVAAGPLICR